ncbi:MAG: hypothetical protein WBE75_00330 [Candidatus Omnitrophota bacterium]
MKMKELGQDLIALGLEDNLNQAKLTYLFATRKGIPLIIDGPPNSGKEFLLSQVLSLFHYNNVVSHPVVFLAKHYFGDRAKAFIISTNQSEESKANLLRLQRERRTIDGIIKAREESFIRSKHNQFREGLENVEVSIPRALKINTGIGATLLDQAVFLNLIEAIAFLDQKDRPQQEREGIAYTEAIEEDFYAAKEILVNTPIFEVHNSLSSEALEFAKDLLRYRDEHLGKEELTREDFLRACRGKYKTFHPIGNKKRLPELIDAGYINITKRGGLKNGYKYAFSNMFNELDSETLTRNRFVGFSLSSLTSFSSLAKEEAICIQ